LWRITELDASTAPYAMLAFLLAWATFVLGIVLLSLSNILPVRWMRETGFMLVADSYSVVFLFTILFVIVQGGGLLLTNVFPPYCYVAPGCPCYGPNAIAQTCSCATCTPGWNAVSAWLSQEKTETIAVMTEVAVPKNLLDVISSLSPVNIEPVISETKSIYEMATGPINNMLTGYMLALVGLEYLTDFLQAYWWQLVFIGAVFWSIPTRIGRIASGWMISFPIVFYLGLPEMHLFMGWFTGYESVLIAFNATALSSLIPSVTSLVDPTAFGITLVPNLLQAGSNFAGYMVLRLITLGLYTTLLASISGGIAAVLSGAQIGETHIGGE
jgi:hypothetical protein